MLFLNTSFRTVFLMLGVGCNFNCRYCMQNGEQVHKIELPSKVNPLVIEFLNRLAEVNKGFFDVRFYGGEPTYYWHLIEEIVPQLSSKIGKSMVTNGSLLTRERVDFCNQYDIHCGVSWDGSRVMDTRYHDVFKENRDNLFALNNIGINTIVTSYAYPKEIVKAQQELMNDYWKATGRVMSGGYEPLFDTGCADRTLFDIDYNRVYRETYELMDVYIEECLKKNQDKVYFIENYQAVAHFVEHFYTGVKNFLDNIDAPRNLTTCGNGLNILNMDLDGNLYPCHNRYSVIGNIRNNNLRKYLNHLLEHDLTRETVKTLCGDCEAFPVCKGGCMLVGFKEKQETYCKLQRALIGGALKRIEDEVKK